MRRREEPIVRKVLLIGLGLLAWIAPLEKKSISAQTPHHPHMTSAAPPPVRYTRTIATYEPPDVTLVGMDDARISLRSALNHDGPIMLQFIFTTCTTVCPVMSAIFSGSQSKLGEELERVKMISISIDPEHDTPERLRSYAKTFKARPQWHFLTGSEEDIVAVQKAFEIYRGDKMRHEPVTFLRAANGRSWLRLEGLMSAAELVDEYKLLTSGKN